jgi:ABC-type proline/glycine betaine transport system permease subunit
MLQIAWVLGTAGPLNPGLRFIRPVTAALCTGLRLLFAAACAIAAYGMSLHGVTRLCPPQLPLATPVYAVGLALATFLGIAAATLAAPRRLAGFTVPCSGILAVALPAVFLLRAGASATYALYLAGAFAGCIGGTRLMLWAAGPSHGRWACRNGA